MSDQMIRGARPGNRRRRPKTFDEGRICADGTCSTLVSRYNRSEFCYNHRPTKFPRMRGVFSDDYASAEN